MFETARSQADGASLRCFGGSGLHPGRRCLLSRAVTGSSRGMLSARERASVVADPADLAAWVTRESGVPPVPDTIMPRPKIFPPAVGHHCYLRHGDRSLMARVFMPRGDTGPFPCLIDLHGGGWQGGDLEDHDRLGRYAGHIG